MNYNYYTIKKEGNKNKMRRNEKVILIINIISLIIFTIVGLINFCQFSSKPPDIALSVSTPDSAYENNDDAILTEIDEIVDKEGNVLSKIIYNIKEGYTYIFNYTYEYDNFSGTYVCTNSECYMRSGTGFSKVS